MSKTNINGTIYTISSGMVNKDGTIFNITKGYTVINETAYNINLVSPKLVINYENELADSENLFFIEINGDSNNLLSEPGEYTFSENPLIITNMLVKCPLQMPNISSFYYELNNNNMLITSSRYGKFDDFLSIYKDIDIYNKEITFNISAYYDSSYNEYLLIINIVGVEIIQ